MGNLLHKTGVMAPIPRLVDWYSGPEHASFKDGWGFSRRHTGAGIRAQAYGRRQSPQDTTTEEMGENIHVLA